MPPPPLEGQLAEVRLLKASTAEREFHWRGDEADIKLWEGLLDDSNPDDGSESPDIVPPLAFALQLSEDIWLNVDYSLDQVGTLSLQSPQISGNELERVKQELNDRHREAIDGGFDNAVFDVFTALQAYLSEHPLPQVASSLPESTISTIAEKSKFLNRAVMMARVIFWTHHLKAPSKKRDMIAWCSELNLWGLVKSGYPGYLCFEGQQDDVQELVRRIKALQWHAITIKTDEPYEYTASDSCTTMDDVRREALRHCLLAKGHSAASQDRSTWQTGSGKLRTTMDEVESGKELVERLKVAAVPEDEYMFALNLRRI